MMRNSNDRNYLPIAQNGQLINYLVLTALTCNTAPPDDIREVRRGVVEWLIDGEIRKLEGDIEEVNIRMFEKILGSSHHVATFFLSKRSMH